MFYSIYFMQFFLYILPYIHYCSRTSLFYVDTGKNLQQNICGNNVYRCILIYCIFLAASSIASHSRVFQKLFCIFWKVSIA